MIGKIYLGLILLFFILAFAVRNIKTYLSTKKSIRGKSIKVSLSVLLSSIIYVLILLRLSFLSASQIMEISLYNVPIVSMLGFIIVTVGFIIGILALVTMKNSWRVGIKYEQKTTLITNGIYRISRNPYFLSYDILIFGYLLIFPSIILLFLFMPLVTIFHLMILEEEKYLESMHGDLYADYKKNTNRYLTIFLNKNT